MLALAPFARLAARAAPRRAAVLAARAYHPAEPEMEHSVVTLDAEGRAPVNPPSLFPQPSYLVNEAAARNRDEPSEANAQALKEAMAADDAAWMKYLQANWPTLAEKKAAVHKAKGSSASVEAFNSHLAEIMEAKGYTQNQGGEWVPDTGSANHVYNAQGHEARWSAAAAGVQMAGAKGLETHADRVAYRNLNARRLAKHGGKAKAGAKKAKTIAIAGESLDWDSADAEFDAVTAHLGACAPLFVDDVRVVVPGDHSVRVVTNDPSAMLMAHSVLEPFPASKQGDNFFNGAKAVNVYLSPDKKDNKAVVGVEDDGSSRVVLTGTAVSESTLRQPSAISARRWHQQRDEA